eukprot:Gregarina_sp_Pseudo_9__4143@NODE_4290_length_451_cov_5_992718_g3959_i0_p2_GENE_NODE_4290_length_451_cov_5_992718_g3959_i0NODE_4290_length_451_cov_5_992718_g3959_i0_p2_ORF_typecomplete_len113_score17_52_NODE_4290_length_451_cov_5_992718_g3959_i085423
MRQVPHTLLNEVERMKLSAAASVLVSLLAVAAANEPAFADSGVGAPRLLLGRQQRAEGDISSTSTDPVSSSADTLSTTRTPWPGPGATPSGTSPTILGAATGIAFVSCLIHW